MLTSTLGSPLRGMPSNENTPCALALAATSIKPPNNAALNFISLASSLCIFRDRVAARSECVAQAGADGVRDMSFGDHGALPQVAHRSLEVLGSRGDAR